MQIKTRCSGCFQTLFKAFSASLLVFLLTPIIEASDRYPTEREMEQLRSQLSRRIQELRSGEFSIYLDDYRTDEERQEYQAFVNAWSKVDPAIAPFLGMWMGYEHILSIYPTSIQGKVCIVENSEVGFSQFTTGQVINNAEIRTRDRRFIIRSGSYLGVAGIYNGQPFVGGEIPLKTPFPLPVPTLLTFTNEELELAGQAEQALQQFEETGCLASLPTERSPRNFIDR
ncbi:MAG: hypothetical protein AB4290_21835 [Spirulina sp.]